MIAPSKPNPEKLSSYECGEEPIGSAWIPFNGRFYVIALIFLLFDVEMIFIFPWATVYANPDLIAADKRWGVFTLTEMFLFAGILILGLVYVWRKKDLEWIKPSPVVPTTNLSIPYNLYDKINQQQSAFKPRDFALQAVKEPAVALNADTATVKKPSFKPTFKKTENGPGTE
jgi:NADH-quinone oxidoreductase subunit A